MEYVGIDTNLRNVLEGSQRKKLKELKNGLIDLIQLNPMDYSGVELGIGFDVMEARAYVVIRNVGTLWDRDREEGGDMKEKLLDDIRLILEDLNYPSVEVDKDVESNPRVLFDIQGLDFEEI